MQEYDEDLSCNPFLKFLQEHYTFLYEEAVRKHWIVCVPSASSLRLSCPNTKTSSSSINRTKSSAGDFGYHFDELYVKQHLILREGDNTKTLADDPVQIKGDSLLVGASSMVQILFRETFYTKAGKVSAMCVRQHDETLENSLNNIKRSPSILQKKLIRETVMQVKEIISACFKIEEVYSKLPRLEECLAQIETHLSHQDVKISNCVIYNLYNQIMDLVTLLASKEDEALNKTRQNHLELAPEQLGLPKEFLPCLSKAKVALDDLPNRKIASDKLDSLRRTINALSETETPTELDADDLLSLLSYLILQSSVNNWSAQLNFIKTFHCSNKYGEDAYLISTLEAALDHVKCMESVTIDNTTPTGEPEDIFHLSRVGDAASLTEILTKSRFKCHPLCNCAACGLPLVQDATRCDAKGFTALHYACINGNTDATQVLLRTVFRDTVDTRDLAGRTALHWAALKGFQTCLLLLCHQPQCDLNVQDTQNNTALHLAVRNGHESCVKALLYYSEQAHIKLDLNLGDCNGDTALHIASRWGYYSIVQLLLQWNADSTQPNRKRQVAADVAQNVNIARLLFQFGSMHTKETPRSRFWSGITRQLSLRRKTS